MPTGEAFPKRMRQSTAIISMIVDIVNNKNVTVEAPNNREQEDGKRVVGLQFRKQGQKASKVERSAFDGRGPQAQNRRSKEGD
jgi:hypothetical protein